MWRAKGQFFSASQSTLVLTSQCLSRLHAHSMHWAHWRTLKIPCPAFNKRWLNCKWHRNTDITHNSSETIKMMIGPVLIEDDPCRTEFGRASKQLCTSCWDFESSEIKKTYFNSLTMHQRFGVVHHFRFLTMCHSHYQPPTSLWWPEGIGRTGKWRTHNLEWPECFCLAAVWKKTTTVFVTLIACTQACTHSCTCQCKCTDKNTRTYYHITVDVWLWKVYSFIS